MIFTVIPDIQTPVTPKIDNIESFLKENMESIKEFEKYAESRHDGIGLAANQCALNDERYNLRLICVKDINTRISTIAVDPVITKSLGRKKYKLEGCLTWIGKTVLAERHPVVEVEYYDLNGDKQTIEAKDFQAQVWQHEINHINGVEEEIHERNFSIPTSLNLEKIGRNEPCTCGSGLKFKKCCGKYE